ncbi:hypothetical protein Mgra_00007907, partial [Meloidogyne graminicola]
IESSNAGRKKGVPQRAPRGDIGDDKRHAQTDHGKDSDSYGNSNGGSYGNFYLNLNKH